MRRRPLLAALSGAAIGGLGGCLRLDSGDGTTTSSSTTATTTTTTRRTTETRTATERTTTRASEREDTETTASGTDSYPVGIDDEGVYAYLVDNHVNTLSDTTFRQNWTVANNTRGETMETERSRVGDARAVMERGSGTDLAIYYDADGGYWRENLGGGATYGEDRRTFAFQWVSKSRRLRKLLLAGDWDSPTANDGTFDIAAAGVDNVESLKREFEADEVNRFEASGVVTPRGVITALTVEFEFLHAPSDRLYEIRTRHRVTDVGDVSVSEPSWYATATERAPQVSVSITDDGNFLVFEHRGGNPIEPATNVVLYDRSKRRNWGYRDNQSPIESGETVYMWMENDTLQWSRGSRPSNATPQSLDRRLAFWMHRHGAEYFGNVELGG